MYGAILLALTAGLTHSGNVIEVARVAAMRPDAPRLVLIGGLDGDPASARAVAAAVREAERTPASRRRFDLYAIALANPERAALVFPPKGVAYRENAEANYLWRWIAARAPDLVLIAGDDAGLSAALSTAPAAVPTPAAIPVAVPTRAAVPAAVPTPAAIPVLRFEGLRAIPRTIAKSETRREVERRLARSPRKAAEELAKVYGLELPQAVYIPAVAVMARMRLGHVEDAERLAAPFVTGARDSLAKPSGSHLSGHLLFAELAERTGKHEYAELARKAADLGFTPDGGMRESMPMHDQMSDAVFMGTPILARVGKLTGNRKYFDMALRHYRYMRALDLRPDGVWRNSPLNDAAWGRGNAFPALGVELALEATPRDHPAHAEFLDAFRRHIAALAPYQNEDGLWRQVIDRPGVYPEFTATAMIATAMLRAIRHGWLDERAYRPAVDRAWRTINARIASDGVLFDVCEGTGKQKTADDYLRRAAIWGRDPRGGAMALLFATEMAGLN
jgi:rhamnogalacturonyl hydrolase YesR